MILPQAREMTSSGRRTCTKVVCEWGMSEAMDPELRQEGGTNLSGTRVRDHKDYSEESAQRIDAEVSRIVLGAYEKAKAILTENMAILERLAQELLEKEVLNAEEIDAIIGITPTDGGASASLQPTAA
jgi:cell division protease FtsH